MKGISIWQASSGIAKDRSRLAAAVQRTGGVVPHHFGQALEFSRMYLPSPHQRDENGRQHRGSAPFLWCRGGVRCERVLAIGCRYALLVESLVPDVPRAPGRVLLAGRRPVPLVRRAEQAELKQGTAVKGLVCRAQQAELRRGTRGERAAGGGGVAPKGK